MQKTRQHILDYLKINEVATVDELSQILDNLTAVTVRHHLDVLRGEGLVTQPEILRRNTPGRPKYVYRLTEKASNFFPQNINMLASYTFSEMKSLWDEQQINTLLNGVAVRMAADFPDKEKDEPMEVRLERITEFLNTQGYEASWDQTDDGFELHTKNCPYRSVTETHVETCTLDMFFISKLLGSVPKRVETIREGSDFCRYYINNGKLAAD